MLTQDYTCSGEQKSWENLRASPPPSVNTALLKYIWNLFISVGVQLCLLLPEDKKISNKNLWSWGCKPLNIYLSAYTHTFEKRCGWFKASKSVFRDTLVIIREDRPAKHLIWGVLVGSLAFLLMFCRRNTGIFYPQAIKGQGHLLLYMIDMNHWGDGQQVQLQLWHILVFTFWNLRIKHCIFLLYISRTLKEARKTALVCGMKNK